MANSPVESEETGVSSRRCAAFGLEGAWGAFLRRIGGRFLRLFPADGISEHLWLLRHWRHCDLYEDEGCRFICG